MNRSAAGPSEAAQTLERARALRRAGFVAEAVADLQAEIVRRPDWADGFQELGLALKAQGRLGEAEIALRESSRLAPRDAAAQLNLGVVALEAGRPLEAVDCFRRALAIDPQRAEAHNILGSALLDLGQCEAAAAALAEALRLKPGYAAAHDNLGRVRKAQGRSLEALAEHRAALASRPEPATHSNFLYTLNLAENQSPEAVAAEHFRWAAQHARFAEPPPALPPAGREGRRIRVGYVSADFQQHAVSFFAAPVLAAHDLKRFEITCYSNGRKSDTVTRRLHGLVEHWRDISRMEDAAVAALVRRERIDILVDLGGHTAGNRLLVFARRPAPVQVTWLGYPNTTGLSQIGYRITDAASDPAGESDARYSERLVRLPGPFLCYEPPVALPPAARLPADAEGPIVFGCFNNLAKVNPGTVRVWCEILRALPRSQLMLKSVGLADPATASGVRAWFANEGVAPERIVCDSERRAVAEHLQLYRRIDVALDPFPYNGTTTTCEALLMGVPVVTLAGRMHASRVGASLLEAVGRREWVAASERDLVARAVELANDRPALARIRAALREELLRSPLCDARGFTRRLEAAYEQMVAAARDVAAA